MNRFTDKTFEQFYTELFDSIRLKIASESDEYIITQPTEDLVKFYTSDCLNPLVFDQDKEETLEHKKYIKTILSHQRERGYHNAGDLKIECEKVLVKIPIVPNRNINQILSLRTNSISLSGSPEFKIDSNLIIIGVELIGYGINLKNEEIAKRIFSTKQFIQSHFHSKNSEIDSENHKIIGRLTQFINERKEKLDSDKKRINDLVNLVKIPLVRKDENLIRRIHVDRQPFVKRLKPKTEEEDYQLDSEKVLDIIKLVNNQCLQFEKTPKTYAPFSEPNLRDLILANLNSIFEGKATGETFNSNGKTDIYLNIDKGNILVSECKFYGGEKLYLATIDQLLGYLSWRHNYGIMITFCKKKNFSKILEEAEKIIKKHPSFDSNFKKLTEGHFTSKNTLPSDDYKYVEIHHLYYNLYSD
jgi:hypothetical protein